MSLDPNTYRKQGYMIQGSGGSEPGELGISPSENTWSDVRLPFHRSHVIPYQLPGMMSAQLGFMNQNKSWIAYSPMGDEIASFRYPVTLAVSTINPQWENNQSIRTGVLPSMSVDPYGSLPDELRTPLFGFNRTALP